MSASPKSLAKGLVVIFEGIDGVGKTTQLQLAKDELSAQGWPVYSARNLGGTPIGEKLREIMVGPLERPSTTNLYLSVAIQEALVTVIEAERSKGQLILMDRGPLSLAAYEIYGGGLDGDLAWPYVDAGLKQLQPDLTIIYKADVKTALARAQSKSRQADYFESQPASYFENVARGYDEASSRYPDSSIVTVDATQTIKAVHEQTMRAIQAKLS